MAARPAIFILHSVFRKVYGYCIEGVNGTDE
jgi:hypothetical protein